jgi:hypothetical protein
MGSRTLITNSSATKAPRARVDPDDVPARREPQLSLAGEQDVRGLVLLVADRGVLVASDRSWRWPASDRPQPSTMR